MTGIATGAVATRKAATTVTGGGTMVGVGVRTGTKTETGTGTVMEAGAGPAARKMARGPIKWRRTR
jgi:hypothetical protein